MNKAYPIRMALLHVEVKQGDMRYTHKVLRQAIAIAAGYGCQLVISGELVECGSDFWRHIYLESVPCQSYPYLEHLKEIAYKYNMHILLGRAERGQVADVLYSTYTHINNGGKLQRYYRKQIMEGFEEASYLTRGDRLICTEIEGLRTGLMIGYNGQAIERMKDYAKQNVDLIVCAVTPTYHPKLFEEIRNTNEYICPTIFCSYDLIGEDTYYKGESICLMAHNSLYFKLGYSAVIVLEYDSYNSYFRIVRSIDINQFMQ